MFVGLIYFSKIKQGKDKDFVEWFEWSNAEFAKFDGFLNRKLLRSTGNDYSYAIIFEMKDERSFKQIHQSKIHQKAFQRLIELLDEIPVKKFYESLYQI